MSLNFAIAYNTRGQDLRARRNDLRAVTGRSREGHARGALEALGWVRVTLRRPQSGRRQVVSRVDLRVVKRSRSLRLRMGSCLPEWRLCWARRRGVGLWHRSIAAIQVHHDAVKPASLRLLYAARSSSRDGGPLAMWTWRVAQWPLAPCRARPVRVHRQRAERLPRRLHSSANRSGCGLGRRERLAAERWELLRGARSQPKVFADPRSCRAGGKAVAAGGAP